MRGDELIVEPHVGQSARRGVPGDDDSIPIAVVVEPEAMTDAAEVQELAADAFERPSCRPNVPVIRLLARERTFRHRHRLMETKEIHEGDRTPVSNLEDATPTRRGWSQTSLTVNPDDPSDQRLELSRHSRHDGSLRVSADNRSQTQHAGHRMAVAARLPATMGWSIPDPWSLQPAAWRLVASCS